MVTTMSRNDSFNLRLCLTSVGTEEHATDLYKYPNNLIPIILRSYKACEAGTECPETSVHKIQKPGNHPQERMQEGTRLAMYV